ncbi:MAG: GTPase HflX [Negativicutes bacterium]|nr:GTPase HflX [Negativicutes bacterium]
MGQESQSHTTDVREKVVLVGSDDGSGEWQTDQSLAELAELTRTAGGEVVSTICQKRQTPDSRFFIGSGKLAELQSLVIEFGADTVIFDDELSPSQQRNLEDRLNCKVIDRSALILDIFAGRARSREGQLQVQLAQLQYRLPRLAGQGAVLSRLGGGIGTRGPGETKLEVDRRRIRTKISEIKAELREVAAHRQRHRLRRQRNLLPVVSLVGYTNAGKSTVLNRLTQAGVLVEDRLFSTLDTTTRRLEIEGCGQCLITDTVGFINKLPHQLIRAFHATLEETADADMLLHVVDLSNPLFSRQITTVNRVLNEIGAGDKPRLMLFNKIDALPDSAKYSSDRLRGYGDYCLISALTGQGIDELKAMIGAGLRQSRQQVKIVLPYSDCAMLDTLFRAAAVIASRPAEGGVEVLVSVNLPMYEKIKKYVVNEKNDQ